MTGALGLLDYGARMYDPTLARWQNVDPLAEKYLDVSGYAFSGNNPIMHVDPNGMDWFENTDGDLFWTDSDEDMITRDDMDYNNIGSSYSLMIESDNFVNYYQDQAISVSSQPLDAERQILGDQGLFNSLMGSDSPLSTRSQIGLMQAYMHQKQGELQLQTVAIGSELMQTTGDAIATVGYAATASGIGAGAGTPLIAIGNGMKYTGLAVETILDYQRGNNQKIIYNGTTNTLMFGVEQMGRFTPGPTRAVFNLVLSPFNWALDYGGSTMTPDNSKK